MFVRAAKKSSEELALNYLVINISDSEHCLLNFETAVKFSTFPGTIAFKLEKNLFSKDKIVYNLHRTCAKKVLEKELPRDIFRGDLYLHIEFSSGWITVANDKESKSGFQIAQSMKNTLLPFLRL